jgi:glycerophosphoryl diester phosphodiesterase
VKWGPVLGFALAWVAMVAPGFAEGRPVPLLAAHRGGSLLWPENSLLAFRSSVALGADYLELDVHRSLDGQIVVIHDPTLERTTTGSGPVRAQVLADLKTLRLRDGTGAVTGETVPTLDEVAAIAARSSRRMLVEIKLDERHQRYPGIEEQVLGILDRHGMSASTVVMAFEPETWRRTRALRPDIAAGALYSADTLRALGSTVARELEAARTAGVGVVGLHQALVDAETVAACRRAGMTLAVWTVNTPDVLRRFIDLGVGIVITDRPDLAKALLDR